FDGDQMPVHIPLSIDARTEARTLMLASNNILKLSDGEPIVTPAQDVVLGCYYLTLLKPGAKGEGSLFTSKNEVIYAYQTKNLDLQAEITVRLSAEVDGKKYSKRVTTSVGRILFNNIIPQNLGYVDRSIPENMCDLEINKPVMKKELKKIVVDCYEKFGTSECSKLVDRLKDIGYKYSTLASISVNIYDIQEPEEKTEILKEAEGKVLENEKMLKRGLITLEEKINENVNVWNDAVNQVQSAVVKRLDTFNPFSLMVLSGARGNNTQLNQDCGMIGIKATASGVKNDTPIKSSFKSGLNPIEYFINSRGSRKGLSDTALKTADSGYLTRRLVDIAQDVVITTDDCFADAGEKVKGVTVTDLVSDGFVQESLEERIYGRVVVNDVVDPKTKEVIVPANTMVSKEQAAAVVKAGIKEVQIRTLITCRCKHGVCAKCYGRSLAGKEMVTLGEAVGIIAAQSIGEPGTQLTMRTFHTGGAAVAADITQGLPRVEEIFEARRPKGECLLSEVSGKVKLKEDAKNYYITVVTGEGDIDYEVRKPAVLKVKNGENVEPGTQLTAGAINPADLLVTKGLKGLQQYLLSEVISVYRGQDVKVNDKHIEIIIRQMLKKVKIEDSGDTSLLSGEVVDVSRCDEENEKALKAGGRPAIARRILLGITKASLSTESFLSASSFQETSRVLTDAALKGKVDNLMGIKENVIIGKLIPAGTGLKQYRTVVPVKVENSDETEAM
ncbi:MAG: DNA-directed RNA polymerase subunit beta', partial [Clostridia bacterium]|nr:DNA-directed RNA polymerase subunit beta' [Clostridia bacterium]